MTATRRRGQGPHPAAGWGARGGTKPGQAPGQAPEGGPRRQRPGRAREGPRGGGGAGTSRRRPPQGAGGTPRRAARGRDSRRGPRRAPGARRPRQGPEGPAKRAGRPARMGGTTGPRRIPLPPRPHQAVKQKKAPPDGRTGPKPGKHCGSRAGPLVLGINLIQMSLIHAKGAPGEAPGGRRLSTIHAKKAGQSRLTVVH